MKINRRGFLFAGSAAAGSALAIDRLIAYHQLSGFSTRAASELIAPRGAGGYGALTPTKTVNTGEPLLALPEGFKYTVIGRAGEKMKDGHVTPLRHDGMATFRIKNELRIVRNHEINNLFGQAGISIGDAKKAYDPLAGGGTSTLVVDPKTRTLIRDFISLGGTLQNCAGGPTPWGSWITCEETTLGPLKRVDARQRNVGGFEKPHGYCFEVSAASDAMVDPVPLKAMGRFVHEAIAVDPRTGYVYETEDAGTAGLYRFIPNKRGQLSGGGKLQMLAVKDQPKYQALIGQKVRQSIPAIWVDITDPDPASAETDPASVYKQGLERGGATFARLEGCWYGQGKIFFTSTSGGESRLGQVWQYEPKGKDDGVLTLLFESPDAQHLEGPDNLCVSPRGGLAICEDGRGEQFVRGLTPDGRIFDFARNTIPGHEDKEFAGATFSPDGETLFFNAQTAGMTFAVWGPWKDGAL